jgi:hypothetical protein
LLKKFLAEIGANIAQTYYMLNHMFSQTFNEKIKKTLRLRILDPVDKIIAGSYDVPYASKAWSWAEEASNWNSVCWSGVMTVALTMLENNTDRLRYVNAALNHAPKYLESFTEDGWGSEGNFLF